MTDTTQQKKREKREYHRRWRAEHPEQVAAAQLRYWNKKAQKKGIPFRPTERN